MKIVLWQASLDEVSKAQFLAWECPSELEPSPFELPSIISILESIAETAKPFRAKMAFAV